MLTSITTTTTTTMLTTTTTTTTTTTMLTSTTTTTTTTMLTSISVSHYLFGKSCSWGNRQISTQSPHQCTGKLWLAADTNYVAESIHGHTHQCSVQHRLSVLNHPVQTAVEMVLNPTLQLLLGKGGGKVLQPALHYCLHIDIFVTEWGKRR